MGKRMGRDANEIRTQVQVEKQFRQSMHDTSEGIFFLHLYRAATVSTNIGNTLEWGLIGESHWSPNLSLQRPVTIKFFRTQF